MSSSTDHTTPNSRKNHTRGEINPATVGLRAPDNISRYFTHIHTSKGQARHKKGLLLIGGSGWSPPRPAPLQLVPCTGPAGPFHPLVAWDPRSWTPRPPLAPDACALRPWAPAGPGSGIRELRCVAVSFSVFTGQPQPSGGWTTFPRAPAS